MIHVNIILTSPIICLQCSFPFGVSYLNSARISHRLHELHMHAIISRMNENVETQRKEGVRYPSGKSPLWEANSLLFHCRENKSPPLDVMPSKIITSPTLRYISISPIYVYFFVVVTSLQKLYTVQRLTLVWCFNSPQLHRFRGGD